MFSFVVFAYQGLFNMEYSFPEEIYDSNKLIVMTSEAPPPIPTKKRRRNTGNVKNYNTPKPVLMLLLH